LEIERKYDYRYSVLPFVFSAERGSHRDLRGLDQGKIELIHGVLHRCSSSFLWVASGVATFNLAWCNWQTMFPGVLRFG
jgi:hypothetical protein